MSSRVPSFPYHINRALRRLLFLFAASAAPCFAQEPAIGLHAGSDYTLEQYANFGAWLGRDVQYRVVFLDRSSWELIGNPSVVGTSRTWVESAPDRVEVISVPLLPTGEDGNFAAILSGARDDIFTAIARRIQNVGIAVRVIIRLGWEGNADWYPWSYQRDPAKYRAAFRRVVGLMRALAPQLRFEFNIANLADRGDSGAKWTEGYPGDDVVDVVSMDIYDHYHDWDVMMTGDAGLAEFRNFAVQHRKLEAYTEWACSVLTNGNGDNADFVQAMWDWMSARPGKVLYQAYWNSADGTGGHLVGRLASELTTAADTFRDLFGPNTAPTISPLADRTIRINTDTGPLRFTIGDIQLSADRLTVVARSSNPDLLPSNRLILARDGANCSVLLKPLPNKTGWATIWLKVSDGDLSSGASFVVNVSAGLQFSDIGAPKLSGDSDFDDGRFIVRAGGYDIYNQRDDFRYGQTLLRGDAEVTVRVASLSQTDEWTKAGLMVRASLTDDAAYAAVFVTPGRGIVLQWRSASGRYAASSRSVPGEAPQWLRLMRTGNVCHAFSSVDGVDWNFVESVEVELPQQAHFGLAVVSHDPNKLATAIFEQFSVD